MAGLSVQNLASFYDSKILMIRNHWLESFDRKHSSFVVLATFSHQVRL